MIVSWWSYSTPLWYAQVVEGRRPDIYIIDDRTRLDLNLGDVYDVIDALLPTRPRLRDPHRAPRSPASRRALRPRQIDGTGPA